MKNLKLFMLLLGCKPEGRNTEQHDVFFGIGESLKDLVPAICEFWPEAKGNIHIDTWREVSYVGEHIVWVEERVQNPAMVSEWTLFFLNLGSYKKGCFDEIHYKFLTVERSLSDAMDRAKQTEFFKENGEPRAPSHIDDKHGVDVDDAFNVHEILPPEMKKEYSICMMKSVDSDRHEDVLNQGYLHVSKIT